MKIPSPPASTSSVASPCPNETKTPTIETDLYSIAAEGGGTAEIADTRDSDKESLSSLESFTEMFRNIRARSVDATANDDLEPPVTCVQDQLDPSHEHESVNSSDSEIYLRKYQAETINKAGGKFHDCFRRVHIRMKQCSHDQF